MFFGHLIFFVPLIFFCHLVFFGHLIFFGHPERSRGISPFQLITPLVF